MTKKKYPTVEIMIGGETTINREMTAEEKEAYDYLGGAQWTKEQLAQMKALKEKQ